MESDDPLIQQIETINPYYRAASLLLQRLLWDINPKSWQSRRKLISLRNKFANQKAVILCNGPSLVECDFSLLDDIYTFGLNKINLLFDKTIFRPSCIVAANPFVIKQNSSFYNQTDIPLFLDAVAIRYGIRHKSEDIFFHSTNINRFARDCSVSLYQGFTVTCVAMQLAYHMGFSKVALIGCDHHFQHKGPGGKVIKGLNEDNNHFDATYFSNGQLWQLPDLPGSEYSFNLAKRIYQASDRQLINCTMGGELNVLERQTLSEFINS